MGTENDLLTPLPALLKYKELAEDPANHSEMVKDKTTLNFLAIVLDSSDEKVLKTSLDTLLLLCKTSCSLKAIQSTFGVVEALNSILKVPQIKSSEVCETADKILKLIETSESPLRKTKSSQAKKKVLTLHIQGLYLETQKQLEDVLTHKVKGVLTVIVDVEHQKCTVTVYEHVDPKDVAFIISENTEMEAKLVTRNKFNQEILVPLIENDNILDLEELPPYLEEQESPVKEKAVSSGKDFRITASEWFCSAAWFLQRTFY